MADSPSFTLAGPVMPTVIASSSVMLAVMVRCSAVPNCTPVPVMPFSVRITVSVASFRLSSFSARLMLPLLTPLLRVSMPLALLWPLGQV